MTTASSHSSPGTLRVLDATALCEQLHSAHPPRVLDVRTPAEFETGHIPSASNVPLDTLKQHCAEIANHLDEDAVLMCQSGQRASQANQALAAAGLPNLRILQGGMQAWEQAGGWVNRGQQRWALERQVRLVAGSLVLGSVLASTAVPALKWLAGAVGTGLIFAAATNTCAMGNLLSRLPYNRGPVCDSGAVIAQLATPPAAADR